MKYLLFDISILIPISLKIKENFLHYDILVIIAVEEGHMTLNRIRDLRQDADLNQTEIAKILGTSQTVYSRYECGKLDLPLRHLVTLCKFYKVSADYILGFTNDPNPAKLKYK